MHCPHCQSEDTLVRLKQVTSLSYPLYFCRGCKRSFNERTGTPFNHLEMPTDILFQVLYCRLRFKFSYRDVAELLWLRGFHFTHETVREWSERFAPEFAEHMRRKWQRTVGRIWYVDETDETDETDVRVQGHWCYLYRGIDEYGNLLDVRLSEHRDIEAAHLPPMSASPPFKWRHFHAEIILLNVRWYLRYGLSYQDLEEMMAERGVEVNHTTIYRWVQAYSPELDKRYRHHLRPSNDSW